MLVGEGQAWLDGVEQAWEILTSLHPDDVCRNTKAHYIKSTGNYVLPLFNTNVYVSPEERRIQGDSGIAKLLLDELPHYSILAILWYLIKAKDIALSGNLVKPGEVGGGFIFTQGSYVLPLERLEERYGDSIEKFVEKGIALAGESVQYGDAAVKLFPFPRVPAVLLIWKKDEEFPARADILFDSTCSEHLPTDILWSTAMMSILLMTTLSV
ncbi:DUF3786 domain-containing protein [Chloroflexota bacterium]